jgi:polyisoprenoid-binding protein YceI
LSARAAGVLLFGLAVLAVLACRREAPRPDRTEPWLAHASAPSASTSAPVARRVPYTLARSRVEFELPGRRGTPRGRVESVRGELDVDLGAPEQSSGKVMVDLTSLVLEGEDGAYTTRALAWLELGARVPAERREAGRTATFTLRSLSSPAGRPRQPDDDRTLKSADFSLKGDLALHGVRAPLSTSIRLEVASTQDGNHAPAELVIRSQKPLVVSLGTHDIRPRDESGVLLPREAALIGDTVGREIRVSFELVFVPRS